MVLCVLDFYRYSSPRGIPLKQFAKWTTSSATTMTVSPDTNQIYFVKSIAFLIDKDADLGANSLNITHSSDTFGGVESTTLSYSSIDHLIAGFSPGTPKEIGCRIKGHIVFDIPIILPATGSKTLTISHTGALAAGEIHIVASGWYIFPEGDL